MVFPRYFFSSVHRIIRISYQRQRIFAGLKRNGKTDDWLLFFFGNLDFSFSKANLVGWEMIILAHHSLFRALDEQLAATDVEKRSTAGQHVSSFYGTFTVPSLSQSFRSNLE